MITQANAPYLSRANEKFERTESNQVRFDPDIRSDWSLNDPVGLGVNLYWVRFRLSSPLNTLPVFDQFKAHTNRMEINADGFQEMFGAARVRKKFPITYGSFQAAANSPGNRDLYLSDSLFVGREENQFSGSARDNTGFAQFLPYDLDTSSDLLLELAFIGESNGSGTVEFTVYWDTSFDGDGVFQSTNQAPTESNNQRSQTFTFEFGSNERRQQKTVKTRLNIPEAIIRRIDSVSDILWVGLERDAGNGNDDYNGNVSVIELALYYQAWNEGGYSTL